MAEFTQNLNLEKPAGNENFRRQVINGNMDKLDEAVAGKIDVGEFGAHLADYVKHAPYIGTTNGTGNAYTVSASGLTSYLDGCGFAFMANRDSTGNCTINANSLGAKNLIDQFGNNITNLKQNVVYTVRYNGTNFIVQDKGAVANAGNVVSFQAGLNADKPQAGMENRYYLATDKKVLLRDNGTKWEAAISGSGGSSSLVLLHNTQTESTSDTSYAAMMDGVIIPDPDRHEKNIIVGLMSRGNGRAKVEVTDGTTTVYAETNDINSATWAKSFLEIDCSTLADKSSGKVWTVTFYGKKLSGSSYDIGRVNVQAAPVDQMTGPTLMLVTPDLDVSTNSFIQLDSKAFPVNYAFDYACSVKALVKVDFVATGSPSADIKFRLTTQNGIETAIEEGIITMTADGIGEVCIPIPTVISPTVKVEVFARLGAGTGYFTLEHYELWLEV